MRLRIEATEDELQSKGPALIEQLAKAFEDIAPDASEILEKALPPREVELKFKALRDIKDDVDAEYERMLSKMNHEIGKVLDDAIAKSFADFTKPIADKDEKMYRRIRSLVLRRTEYTAKDFEPGGVLDGLSSNQLLDKLEEEKSRG